MSEFQGYTGKILSQNKVSGIIHNRELGSLLCVKAPMGTSPEEVVVVPRRCGLAMCLRVLQDP